MGLSVHGGDVLCHEGGYYKVELACRTDGQYALLTIPLVIARREGHACVLRPAASRQLIAPRGHFPTAWYSRGDDLVAF